MRIKGKLHCMQTAEIILRGRGSRNEPNTVMFFVTFSQLRYQIWCSELRVHTVSHSSFPGWKRVRTPIFHGLHRVRKAEFKNFNFVTEARRLASGSLNHSSRASRQYLTIGRSNMCDYTEILYVSLFTSLLNPLCREFSEHFTIF